MSTISVAFSDRLAEAHQKASQALSQRHLRQAGGRGGCEAVRGGGRSRTEPSPSASPCSMRSDNGPSSSATSHPRRISSSSAAISCSRRSSSAWAKPRWFHRKAELTRMLIFEIMTSTLFSAPAYKTYGTISPTRNTVGRVRYARPERHSPCACGGRRAGDADAGRDLVTITFYPAWLKARAISGLGRPWRASPPQTQVSEQNLAGLYASRRRKPPLRRACLKPELERFPRQPQSLTCVALKGRSGGKWGVRDGLAQASAIAAAASAAVSLPVLADDQKPANSTTKFRQTRRALCRD